MKRAREENAAGPQFKRPAASRGETSGPAQSNLRLTTVDALAYLKAVKDMFKDKKGKYDEFLEVMKDFKAQRIDTAGVITRVKELFKDHRDLILGFNTFLPKGFEITLSMDEECPKKHEEGPKKQPVEFNQAISYVNKIKTRFQHDEQVYKAFLEILNKYRKGNKSINEVYQEVAALFRDHQDLLEEFTYFLPDSSGVVHPPLKVTGSSMSRREDKSTGMAMPRQPQVEKVTKKEKMASVPSDRDHSSEKPADREQHDRAAIKADKEQRKKGEKEKGKKDEREQKERDKDDKDSEQEQEKDLDAMQRLPNKRKSARRADELIRKQSQVGEGGEAFPGSLAPASSVEEKKVPKVLQKKLAFFEKVKCRLRSHETYQEFLKCLNLYSEEIITRAQLHSLVDDLLGKFPDLVEGFNDFLTHCESNEGYLANVVSKKLGNGPLLKPKIEKESEKDKDREKDKERDREKDGEQDREKEKERERDKLLSHPSREVANHKVSLLSNKEKYMSKPISELDLSNCERCTPSYRLLPKNYPKLVVSHHTDLARGVLNDIWVSVTSGSEDYSFKHMRKNQYEESLFRCEDDRFELDMLLESTAATAKRVEELLEKMRDKQDFQFQVEEHLTAINIRCVERIYGDHGIDVIDLLRKNASVALPVILSRLKQKQDEWSKCRADMNKVWAEVYAKNYHKSLDHRSFYFKQQDKKSLSTKALLAEIKDINEKKRKDDDVILSIAAGNRRPLIPDLKFEYFDHSINEDLYRIIKYSADEMCTTMEQSHKIMRIWTEFLEPIFGVPSRPHGAEDTEKVVKVKPHEAKENGLSNGESDGSAAACGNVNGKQVGLVVEMKHATPLVDDTTVSSKVEAENMDRSCLLAANEVTSFNDEMKVGTLGSCGHKNNNLTAGIFQPDKGQISGSNAGTSEMNGISKQNNGFERLGDGYPKRTVLEMNPSRVYPEILLGATTGRPTYVNSDRGHALVTKVRDFVREDVDRRAILPRRENKIPEMKVGAPALKCSRDEITRNGSLGRIEREEGELSPSSEVEDRHAANYGSGDNLVSLAVNIAGDHILEDGAPNHVFGTRPDEDEDAECDVEAECEPDADADDEGEESAQKTSEDSENASEAGEEVSGTESGDADDSHEDHEEEEEEDEEHEGKNESEGEAEGIADAHDAEGDVTSLASLDTSLFSCRPLTAHGPSIVLNSASDRDSTVFYGNDALYVLFRLHQTLYERIYSAKIHATAAEQKWKVTKDTASPALYDKFLQVLHNLLDGSADNAKFEDDCRAIIGTQSYVLFTLDKLIFKLVKQLQAIASDEMANKSLALHSYENSRASGGLIDVVYHANACVLLHDENIYKFEHRPCPSQLFIQLMEGGPEKLEVAANAMEFTFSKYLNDFLLTVPDLRERHFVFLARNKFHYSEGDEYTAMVKAMRNVRVANGLEYKISCNTSKVSYVLDTEDLLYRRKRKRGPVNDATHPSATLMSSRVHRFHKWIDSHSSHIMDR